MSRKSIIFDAKKISKINFYIKINIFKIDDIDVNKLLVSKKEPYRRKTHLNTLLDIVTMMILDHYV